MTRRRASGSGTRQSGSRRAVDPPPARRVLLEGLFDYAGLFPPAGLGMADTVRNYAAYQRRADSWALGRLVVPVARLAEFEAARDALSEEELLGTRWPLTGLLGADPVQDVAMAAAFNERHAHAGPRVMSLEGRAGSLPEVAALRTAVPSHFELFIELPLGRDMPGLVVAAKQVGARAKVRTGGVNAADIPEPEAVLAFLARCAESRTPFKATAGLHHPVRGPAPLSYAPDSARATMFGFLNLVLAATLLWQEGGRGSALRLLTAEDRGTLALEPDEARWAGVRLSRDAIARARREFVLAIGTCSFTEPVDEIAEL